MVLQGFQVVCHSYDGMGGAASVACELLQDDYSTKTILCLPATPPTTSLLRPSARTPLLVNTMLVSEASTRGLCSKPLVRRFLVYLVVGLLLSVCLYLDGWFIQYVQKVIVPMMHKNQICCVGWIHSNEPGRDCFVLLLFSF